MTVEDVFEARTRMPPAPDLPHLAPEISEAITRRRAHGIHDCVFCGRPARAALYWHTSDLFPGAAWLDACWGHYAELVKLVTEAWPPDGELIARYEKWSADRDQGQG